MGASVKSLGGQEFGYAAIGYVRKYFYPFSVSQHLELIGQLVSIFISPYFLWYEMGEPSKELLLSRIFVPC